MFDVASLSFEEDQRICEVMNDLANNFMVASMAFDYGADCNGHHEIHMHFIDDDLYGKSLRSEFTIVGKGASYKAALGDIMLRTFPAPLMQH